ncbi:MAG: DUF4097 family beta strand repeat-containing protein [Firmicutes bacterium]|nr:DUF4097 family beta strand repeat-containing protein [Bacillota bacterium]
MTTFQKVIKYLAVALAIFLIVTIIGGIITGLSSVSYLLSGRDEALVGQMQTYRIDEEISDLSIDLSGAELIIQTGDEFCVESNHKYINVNAHQGKLRIHETKKVFGVSPQGVTVILTIPRGFVFDEASIDTGAGKVSVDTLSCDVLKLSLGAGRAEIHDLTANSRARIDGGAGELVIDGGKLRNLDFDMGVGALKLKSRIEGDSELDYGVGETNLILLGSRDDYRIKIDKGIGEAKLEGQPMRDDSVYGGGEHRIDIDGGIGAICIEFAQN